MGGHETVLREMADGLADRGWEVDFLTSTAESIYTWENVLSPGVSVEKGLTIHRFEALPHVQPQRDRLGARILAGERLDMAEQYRWANAGMRLPGLYDFLTDHSRDYRAIVCGPYMFWACLVLADLAPERTIILPALHDEPFARLEVYRYQMRSAHGLWFETEPELALAKNLDLVGERCELVGSAVDLPDGIDVTAFRSRFGIEGPYFFYAGRREWGKGWPQLLEDLAFAREVLGDIPPLVTCGIGDIGEIPAGMEVLDLGKIPDPERASGQAGAAAYIQPSGLEAFSRTVVEALLLETPVVANWNSAVVRWHCERSGAGLTYRDRYEFAECVRLARDEPGMLAEMAKGGPAYVNTNFSWPVVLERADKTLRGWF